ncbi:MAG TPA: protein kinase [Planctomycetota bacterium]|nr:protein kinase [Planctomycetota bacterium]
MSEPADGAPADRRPAEGVPAVPSAPPVPPAPPATNATPAPAENPATPPGPPGPPVEGLPRRRDSSIEEIIDLTHVPHKPSSIVPAVDELTDVGSGRFQPVPVADAASPSTSTGTSASPAAPLAPGVPGGPVEHGMVTGARSNRIQPPEAMPDAWPPVRPKTAHLPSAPATAAAGAPTTPSGPLGGGPGVASAPVAPISPMGAPGSAAPVTANLAGAVHANHDEDAEAEKLQSALNQIPLVDQGSFDEMSATQDGASPSPPPRPTSISGIHIPQIPGHEVVEEIGRGAMGLVYHARDRRLGRSVAIKILRAGELASGSTIERFRREAMALARISHPVIVPIYDVGDYNGLPYFTMEFIAGRSLTELINKREIATMQALEWSEKIADALDMAHQHGVIHRDVKPSNIMVDKRSRVRLMDFGLAKHMDSDSHYTVSGTTIGTPAYMPPEQARGTSSRVDARSDVYGLGAVLYEMVAGRPPFTGKSVLDVIMKVLNEEPEPPRKYNPQLHPDIQTIILKCLEKNPEQRYVSALALRDDIARFRNGEPIQARPPSLHRQAARWISRYRASMITAVSAVILVLAVYEAIEIGRKQGEQNVVSGLPPTALPAEQKDVVTYKAEVLYEAKNGPLETLDINKNPAIHWRQNAAALYDASSLFPTRATLHESYFAEPPWFESAKAEFEVTLAPGAYKNDSPDPELNDCLRVGFSTFVLDKNNESILPLIVTWSNGRLRLHGVESPDSAVDQVPFWKGIKALRETPGPLFKPGHYRVVVEKQGWSFTCLIYQADHPEQAVGSLTYHDLNLMKWQFKHMTLSVRKASGPLTIDKITGYRRSLTAPSNLMTAYSKLFIGEFQGSVEGFEDLTSASAKPQPGVPEEKVRAWLGLGLSREIRNEFPEAEAAYARTMAECQARLSPHSTDTVLRDLYHTARSRHLIVLLHKKDFDKYRQEVADLNTDATLGDWSGSAVRTLDTLRRSANFREALSLIRLLDLPGGSENCDGVAVAIAQDIFKLPRPDGDPLLAQLAELHPTAAISETLLPRIQEDRTKLATLEDPAQAAALRASIAERLELVDRPLRAVHPMLQPMALEFARTLDVKDEEQQKLALVLARLHAVDHDARIEEFTKLLQAAAKYGQTEFVLKLYDTLAATFSFRDDPPEKRKDWGHQWVLKLDEAGRMMLDNDQPVSSALPLLENRDDPALLPLITRCVHSLTRQDLPLEKCQLAIPLLRQARRVFQTGEFASSELKEQARTEFNLRVGDLAGAVVAKPAPSKEWKALLLKILYEYPDRSETKAVRRGVELLMAEPDGDVPAAINALKFLVVARSNLRSEGWPLEGMIGWLMQSIPAQHQTAAQELVQRMLEGNTDDVFAAQWALERADMLVLNKRYDTAWRLLEGVAMGEGRDEVLGRWRAAALLRMAALLEWTPVEQQVHIGNPTLFLDGEITSVAVLKRIEKQGADVEITKLVRKMLNRTEPLQDVSGGFMLAPAAFELPALQTGASTDRGVVLEELKQFRIDTEKDHRWPASMIEAIDTTWQAP